MCTITCTHIYMCTYIHIYNLYTTYKCTYTLEDNQDKDILSFGVTLQK